MALFNVNALFGRASFDFIGKKWVGFGFSIALSILTISLLFTRGLNFGIDFTGGILIEARFVEKVELGDVRSLFKDNKLADVSLQGLENAQDVLIRVGNTSDANRAAVIDNIKNILAQRYSNIEYRKVDYVGPKIGSELIKSGILALFFVCLAIMVYIWFRFEWQYGVGAVVSIIHDAVLTMGFFSLTQLEFNMSSIATVLTVIGYSINDTVVIFDRIRDNLRKFKKMPLDQLINLSINDSMSRTIMTSLTTILAITALVLVGGEVVKSFSLSMFFGVFIGTFSSIYIAAPLLIFMDMRKTVER